LIDVRKNVLLKSRRWQDGASWETRPNQSLQPTAQKRASADLSDKLTVSGAHGQLIGGGCFAIALDRLRSRSAYQGQWSRLRFSVLA